jgi:DNA-binding beta-propeller fold protein YncE
VYYTELPTPGVAGGLNKVSVVETDSTDGPVVLHMGEPEPTDIAVSRHGDLYWTCKSAGVILHQDEDGVTAPLLTGLSKPVGIAVDHKGRLLYWTEVPTPGVSGANGGTNKVWQYNLKTGVKTLVHSGDPEPTDVTVSKDGTIYWTCSSAGVIVEASKSHH